MMVTWLSVIATNPAGPEAPVRATPLAGHFRRAAWAFRVFRTTSSCRRPKPSPMHRLCWTAAWRSTRTKCSRPRGRPARTARRHCGKLAQLAVGVTHVQRGNVEGAITVLRRASAGLAQVDKPAPYAIDIAGLVDYADVLIDDLAANAAITPDGLRPRLVVVRPQ